MRRLSPTLVVVLAAAALAVVVSAADRGPPAPPADSAGATPAPGVVHVETARRLIEAGTRVVDVRTPQEFAAGHVAGALNIPFDEIDRRAAEIGPPGTPVVLYCRSGRRSGIAADRLKTLGYDTIYDFQRFSDWTGPTAAGQ